jgi:hypothetical protein
MVTIRLSQLMDTIEKTLEDPGDRWKALKDLIKIQEDREKKSPKQKKPRVGRPVGSKSKGSQKKKETA